ncbi:MAG: hypothetical protein HYU66_21375, partial [Armatimonadetes bacterium]|nr:hypothetical protein [Armatimonadota bacterium]
MTQILEHETCGQCGELVHDHAIYCPGCGQRREAHAGGPTVGRILAAALLVLLAIPLGVLGGGCLLIAAKIAVSGITYDYAYMIPALGVGAPVAAVAIGLTVCAARLLHGKPKPTAPEKP